MQGKWRHYTKPLTAFSGFSILNVGGLEKNVSETATSWWSMSCQYTCISRSDIVFIRYCYFETVVWTEHATKSVCRRILQPPLTFIRWTYSLSLWAGLVAAKLYDKRCNFCIRLISQFRAACCFSAQKIDYQHIHTRDHTKTLVL